MNKLAWLWLFVFAINLMAVMCHIIGFVALQKFYLAGILGLCVNILWCVFSIWMIDYNIRNNQ